MHDRDTINGVILIVCFGAIYYHWIIYELRKHMLEQFVVVEQKLFETRGAVSAVPHLRRPRALLKIAEQLMHNARDAAAGDSLDDLFSARQLLSRSSLCADQARLLSARMAVAR